MAKAIKGVFRSSNKDCRRGRSCSVDDVRQSTKSVVRRCQEGHPATSLVVNKNVFDAENGALVSEVRFKKDTERRFIKMDETYHDLSITGDKGGSRAVSYHNPRFQRGATRGVKSARHVTGAYATNVAGAALPPFYIFDSSANRTTTFVSRLIGSSVFPL